MTIPEKQLRDLLFELEDSAGPKVLIGVSDDPSLTSKLHDKCAMQLSDQGKEAASAPASALLFNPLQTLINLSRNGTIGVIQLTDFDNVAPSDFELVLRQLNFHRDAIAALKVPILLWLSTEQLYSLINEAPDFWSRRTSVYYFTSYSSEQLLAKLFARKPLEIANVLSTETEAVQSILEAERSLAKCMNDKAEFSLPKVDRLINEIRTCVDTLSSGCRERKSLEITVNLWTLTHLDRVLYDRLRAAVRGNAEFQYLNSYENEVLVFLAERLHETLGTYLSQLGKKIRRRQSPDLLSVFRSAATSKMKRVALEIAQTGQELRGGSADLELYSLPGESVEDLLRARATRELEFWANGSIDTPPKYLTPEEARIVRHLYNSQSPLMEISSLAEALGMSRHALNAKLRETESKIRRVLDEAGYDPKLAS